MALRGVAWSVLALAGLAAWGWEKFGFLSKSILALAVAGVIVLEVPLLVKRHEE